ncbi:hypothetical protein A2291_05010 [candidate division WOR-1 bacterium RIFOXYB2_FULL_42_35]|uniref:DUF1565 domain-containing protein n=1 Tax=candidate division WOR-1 bacterium RIFOXYC2_FULL_41_25 TaxID=1802586 RepID=A0A1F4TNC8_UNCSA|nr:MAG: hypothetical protein A2247_07210 [candidate division WOR-1 bacterium RIFOXYA2_FULL_41_14]OGC24689.1 MAG: hypothetical protein A2291_05010 [candidate division WOR-1 bacterium RIFOXYB2_FULL_42_35]OGC34204.1 MAG: hypothetical protein A2462_08255 [candidate division WOR-1 bacterium RIFOXYC2_FULL_41_25]OGC41390.1 MAG: hypothetical protein A2548_00930 [candidate division WOR-1 bacterium RIFOXYD2_FULL_41_8]
MKKCLPRLVIVVCFGLFFLLSSAYAATYYVDGSVTTGNITGDGSAGNPWQTITYALTQTSTGDIVSVTAGKYTAGMIGSSESFPINIPAYVHLKSPDQAEINAESNNATVVILSNNSTLENFTVHSALGSTANGAVHLAGTGYVLSNSISAEAQYACAVYITSEADSSLVSNNWLYTNTNGGAGSILKTGRGVHVHTNATNITIQGNTIETYAAGVYIDSGSNATIANNLIYGTSQSGAGVGVGINAYGNVTSSSNEVRYFSSGIACQTAGLTITVESSSLLLNQVGVWSSDGTWDITNTIIAGNKTQATDINNAGFWGSGGTVNVNYSNVIGVRTDTAYPSWVTTGSGTISALARFADPNSNNYYLSSNSPCLGSGTPEGINMGRYGLWGNGPIVYILVPNGGEEWVAGANHNITWYASDESGIDGINLYYSIDNGSSYTLITNESNSGSYTWTVANSPTDEAKIKIEAISGANTSSDESDATFTIIAGAGPTVGSITLKDIGTGNTTYSNNQIVSVEVSSATGSPTQMIASEEASFTNASWQTYSATFEYTVSSGDGTKTVYYKVRDASLTVSSTVSASIILDTSSPAVILYQPNGGESLTGGSSYSITWEAIDAVSSQAAISINLKYSTNAGSSWSSIASAQTNNGSYSWTVPSANSSLCRVSIEAIDQAGNIGYDSSVSNFTITSEDTSPSIAININGVTIKNNDYIPVRPTFVAVITDSSSVDTSSIIMTLDGASVSPTVTLISSTTVEASYAPTADLANESIMTHAITVEAGDLIGNTATKEISGLKVSNASARVVGNVLAYPTKFNPPVDLTCTISYTLSANANITIYIIGPVGTVEWTNKINSGAQGGRAGYNAVPFNGISDLSGTYLGNGIYPIKITSGTQAIGTGYIVIFM